MKNIYNIAWRTSLELIASTTNTKKGEYVWVKSIVYDDKFYVGVITECYSEWLEIHLENYINDNSAIYGNDITRKIYDSTVYKMSDEEYLQWQMEQ
jgi:hypothetical protein